MLRVRVCGISLKGLKWYIAFAGVFCFVSIIHVAYLVELC